MQGTHYEVLGVSRDASAGEIKAAYQRRVLEAHPDKAGEQHTECFQELQAAWQVLREPAMRARYDHQLSQAELRATVVLHDEIELDDMLQDSSSEQQASGPTAAAAAGVVPCEHPNYSYPCRCGDSFVLTAADMELAAASHQIIVPCRSCSNHILVKLPP